MKLHRRYKKYEKDFDWVVESQIWQQLAEIIADTAVELIDGNKEELKKFKNTVDLCPVSDVNLQDLIHPVPPVAAEAVLRWAYLQKVNDYFDNPVNHALSRQHVFEMLESYWFRDMYPLRCELLEEAYKTADGRWFFIPTLEADELPSGEIRINKVFNNVGGGSYPDSVLKKYEVSRQDFDDGVKIRLDLLATLLFHFAKVRENMAVINIKYNAIEGSLTKEAANYQHLTQCGLSPEQLNCMDLNNDDVLNKSLVDLFEEARTKL